MTRWHYTHSHVAAAAKSPARRAHSSKPAAAAADRQALWTDGHRTVSLTLLRMPRMRAVTIKTEYKKVQKSMKCASIIKKYNLVPVAER